MNKIMSLFNEYKNLDYKLFNSRTIPNISIDKILGVTIPNIRKISKLLTKEEKELFLNKNDLYYQEEYLLYGVLLNEIKDIDKLIKYLDNFLPKVDNWEVTDIIKPKIILKHHELFLSKIKEYLNSNNEYMIRFGVVSLLNYYLDDLFNKNILLLVSKIKYDSYYVNMSIAWFYSFAIIKQYEDTIGYLENKKLSKWIHNKTISKCLDSYRIDQNKKEYLRSLKWK